MKPKIWSTRITLKHAPYTTASLTECKAHNNYQVTEDEPSGKSNIHHLIGEIRASGPLGLLD